jgi:glycosyltransferase involved in cell wall biosynthesis
LEQGKTAGGHVKCWERFAEAATQLPAELDLTVHFLGDKQQTLPIAENVRFQHHRPMLGTRSLAFLKQGAGHTDLAPFHIGLNAALADCDIIHATDFFSFGRTGLAHARRHGKGLVASIHTDTPQFTRIYAGDIIKRMVGARAGSLLVDSLHLPDRIADRMSAAIDRRLQACHQVLVSKPEDYQRLAGHFGPQRLNYLRRGIDRQRFSPSHRDRSWLQQRHDIPADRTVLMFAGRVDASKSVMVMAEAVRHLLDDGHNIHALIVGNGEDRGRIAALLGDRVTMPGNVGQSDLAKLYANADLFLFPSTTEVCPNVVIEAKASGLPVMVAASHGGAQFIRRPGIDGLIAEDQRSKTWAKLAQPILEDAGARQAIGQAARRWSETDWPSWTDVLRHDLLNGWQRAADAVRNATAPARRPAIAGRGVKIGWSENGIR